MPTTAPPDLPELLTIGQVAELLHVHSDTLRRWERDGRLKPIRAGKKGWRRYPKTAVLKLSRDWAFNSGLSHLHSSQLLLQAAYLMRNAFSKLDLVPMAQTVVDEAVKLICADCCLVCQLEPDGQTLKLLAQACLKQDSGFIAPEFAEMFVSEAQLLLRQVLVEDTEVMQVSNIADLPVSNRAFFETYQLGSMLCAPLKDQLSCKTGLLVFLWAEAPRLFTQEELAFVQSVAVQAGPGFENARAYQRQQARTTELEAVFDTMADGVVFYDSRSNSVRLNKAAERILDHVGSSEDPARLPKSWQDYNPRKLHGEVLSPQESPVYRSALLGETITNFELVLQGESGPDTVINCSASPLFDEQNALRGGMLVFRNVSQQYATQEQLLQLSHLNQTKAAELEALFEAMVDGIIVCDNQGQLVRWNKAARRIYQYDEELQGATTPERIKYFNLRNTAGRQLLPPQVPAYRASVLGETLVDAQLVVNGESGPNTVISCNAIPLYDQQGRLQGGVSVVRNTTEQYLAQQRIQELSQLAQFNAARLEAVIESVADGIMVYDNASRITLVNQRVTEFYGLNKSDMLGLTSAEFAKIVKPLMAASVDLPTMVNRVEQSLTSYTEELELVSPRRRVIQRLVTPVMNSEGQLQGKVALYHDITEERSLARAKDEFIALATHELKTPLTAVKGFAQLLVSRLERYNQSVPAGQPVKLTDVASLLSSAQKIAEQSSRLNGLMNDLLDMSRISLDRLQLQTERFDLLAVVRQAIEQVQATTSQHRINLIEPVPTQAFTSGDPGRIEQVVRNLLENAVKYTPQGGLIRVSIQYQPVTSSQSARWQISITDQGIGIPLEQQGYLFDKFYRASNANGVAVGLGLGLSICAEIIRQHAGRIWAVSPGEGEGSTFAFEIPASE